MPIPLGTAPLELRLAKDRVYYEVRDWIIQGQIKSGEKLVDTEIAEYFSVSRTPVREAFQLLEAQKLVKITPGKGTEVSGVDVESFRSWYQTLALLQGFAAEKACHYVTPKDITKLQQLNDLYREKLDGGEIQGMLQADTAIHDKVVTISRLEIVGDFSLMLRINIERVEYQYYTRVQEVRSLSVSSHQKIINALRNKDGPKAREAMAENWLQSMATYERILQEQSTSF